MRKALLFLIFFPYFLFSQSDVESIIKKADELMRGKTSYVMLEMKIITPRYKRTVKMEGWSEGEEKSFIRILYPKKERGVTFLKLDDEMWQYIPKIERILKIPPSMMLQSWMGSDFTNDDLVKSSSMVHDYDKKLLDQNKNEWVVKLIPKPEAAVVWGKLVLKVQKETFVISEVKYYDEENVLMRTMHYEKIEKIKDRFVSKLWRITPETEDKKGQYTIIDVQKIIYDEPVDGIYFTKRALKKFSKR